MEAPQTEQYQRLARLLWQSSPRVAARVWTTLAISLADGVYLYRLDPRMVFVGPVLFILGLLLGWQHLTFAQQATYTASLWAMGIMLFAGTVSQNLGALTWLGYIVGEFFLRSAPTGFLNYQYSLVLRQRIPMVLSYALLSTLVFGIPLVARTFGRTAGNRTWLGPARRPIEAAVGAVLLSALVYLWAQSTATLIRPIYTWVGSLPPTEAIAPLQKYGWVLSVVAVLGCISRTFLESRGKPEMTPHRLGAFRIAPTPFLHQRLPPGARLAVGGLGTALLLSGLFDTWFDAALTVAVVIALRVGRVRIPVLAPSWAAAIARVPLLLRAATAMWLSYWLSGLVIGWSWFSTRSFRVVLACVFLSMTVSMLFLPDLRPGAKGRSGSGRIRPAAMMTLTLTGLVWLLLGRAASADNCSSLDDCYGVIAVAAIAAVAIAVAVVLLPELLLAAEAAEVLEGVVAAEEAAAAAAVAGADAAAVTEAATGAAVSAETAIATGTVGARLGSALEAIQAAFQAGQPTTALGALQAVSGAVASVGLEVGIVSGTTAGGTIAIQNVGGVTTYLFNNGQILIMRGQEVLMNLIP